MQLRTLSHLCWVVSVKASVTPFRTAWQAQPIRPLATAPPVTAGRRYPTKLVLWARFRGSKTQRTNSLTDADLTPEQPPGHGTQSVALATSAGPDETRSG
jgi:hypothetical protein